MGNAERLKKLNAGTLVLVFAGLAELVKVQGFAEVVNGSAEADQFGIEMSFGEFSRDAVNQRARCVVDENEMGQETRRRRDLLENARGLGRQGSVPAGGERIGLGHSRKMRMLFERPDQSFDFRQCGCEGSATVGIRCPLRKNVFALKVEGLAAAFGCRAFFGGKAPFCFAHGGLSGAHRFLISGVCHLLFHRFTFPAARHMFILRAMSKRRTTKKTASNQI